MKKNYFLILFLLLAVFMGYSQSASDLNLKKSTVDIPWHEFKSVIEKITRTVQPTIKDTAYPPVDFCLKSVKLSGKVIDRKTARFTANIDLTINKSKTLNKNGWLAVPIGDELSSNANQSVLESALINGNTVPIHNKNGINEVLFSKAGNHKLTLKYFCPIQSYEGNWEIRLNLPRAASGSINFDIPKTKANIFINGVKQNPNISKKGTTLKTAISLDQHLTVKYSLIGDGIEDKFDAFQMLPKVFATTSMLMTIKENRVRYQYRIDYQLWHQKLKTFKIALPDSLPIENVSGAGLAEWKIKKNDKGAFLEAKTSFAPERAYTLTLDFSKKLETVKAEIVVPVLKPLGVNRENGFLAVQASETMEVFASDNIKNLVNVPASELPSWLQNQREVLLRYKYNKTPYSLTLNVLRHQDMPVIVAIADEALFTGLITQEGYYLIKYRYFIRNNHKQYLSLKMPKNWKLWSALIDGNAVLPASTDSINEVLIPLKKMSRTDEGTGFVLELVYWHEGKKFKRKGALKFETPVIDINCQKIVGELWMPNKFVYSSFKGSLEKLDQYSTRYLSSSQSYANKRNNFIPPVQSSNTFTYGKSGRSLSLPVEIAIPKSGSAIKFSKELTIAGEKGNVEFKFSKKSKIISQILQFVIWIILIITSIIISKWFLGNTIDGSKKEVLISLLALLLLLFVSRIILNDIFNLSVPVPQFTIILGFLFTLISHFGSLKNEEVTA